MKLLIYGAGVIGSIFAGKLSKAGYDVTMLARGERYKEIKKNGIVLNKANSDVMEVAKVNLIDLLLPDDIYDYIFVVMQKMHVEEVLPILAQNKSHNIVFVVNNALGYEKWAETVGKERIMIGFPSAGGERKNGVVSYFVGSGIIRSFQTTTFGEYNGSMTGRLNELIKVFKKSEIPAVYCDNMDAWQKTHVAMVTCIANILYKYDGNNYELAKSWEDIYLMIYGIKEGFNVLKKFGYSVTPKKLYFFLLPANMLTIVFKQVMGTKLAEITMAKHTIAAAEEMLCLQAEFDSLIAKSGVNTPSIDKLRQHLYEYNK